MHKLCRPKQGKQDDAWKEASKKGTIELTTEEIAPGDVIEVAGKAKSQLRIKASSEAAASRGLPEWMEVDTKGLKGTFKNNPARADLSSTINESLIIELYSK